MKIALIGYGIENASAWRYLSVKYPDAEFAVYDEKITEPQDLPEGIAFVGGTSFMDVQADLLVRSPGISPYKLPDGANVTSATKLFFEAHDGPIVGVTGSKGKGTTASLIASILRAGGKTAWLVGNIGTPALDVLDQIKDGDVVVYELSSFQLWDLKKSPQTAVVLMIEPEHLDVHRDLEDYIEAKANIARFQAGGDRLIYNAQNAFAQRIANLSAASKTAYPDESAAHVQDDTFYYGSTALGPVSALKLPGLHNVGNALAAIDAAWPFVSDPAAIIEGLGSFDGLPHRLKYVDEVYGTKFYDDSIATTPGSAIAAIHAFTEPKVLILGGSGKGADFDELGREVAGGNVRHVVLIGDEAPQIEASLVKAEFSDYTVAPTGLMENIVTIAFAKADGATVILSPACASFGLFKNYADRGDQFIAAVEGLKD